jgi:TPR repeat protein
MAAEKGDAAAMMSVGVLYEKDRRAPRDPVKARAWYQKALDGGYKPAKTLLSALDARERGEAKPKRRP